MRIGVGELRLYPDADPRSLPLSMRRRHVPIVRVLPGIGLMACWGLLALLAIFAIYPPHLSKGIRIQLEDPGAARQHGPWKQTVGLYVRGGEDFRVNEERIARERLREKLLSELGRQAVWVVYVEADVGAKFGDVAYALGTAEGLGARVVWMTPGIRADWEQKAGNVSFVSQGGLALPNRGKARGR